jgi:hypothetical protein
MRASPEARQLEHALANDGAIEYVPLGPEPE